MERCPHTGYFPLIVHPMLEWVFIKAGFIRGCCYVLTEVSE